MKIRKVIGDKLGNEKIQICIITLTGILMRLGYVLYTPFMMGQHDLIELGTGVPMLDCVYDCKWTFDILR